jgi:hypothetical protein
MAAAAALALALAACSSGGSAESTAGSAAASSAPSVAASPSPPAGEVFVSSRHGYQVAVPEGWRVKEFGGTWESLDQFSPGSEVPGEDVVGPIGLAAFMVMDSMAIPEGTTPEEWLADFNARVMDGLPENCPGTVGSGEVAGEPATVIEQPCGRAVVVGRSLVHGDRGYYFTTMHTEDDLEAKAILDEVVASVTFTD